MALFRSLVATLFILIALGIVGQYAYVRRRGLLLGAASYGGGGILALSLQSWWPLAAGFAFAWVLGRLGADPPVDVRLDLPVLDRAKVEDASLVHEYLRQWIIADEQVRLIASPFVTEAWERGCRRPADVPDDPAWREASPTAAWHRMVASDLRTLMSATRSNFVRHLDWIDQVSTPTLLKAGHAAVKHDLPSTPPDFASVIRRIPDEQERREYAESYVADTLLAARLRVLAWTFQWWHGERYELPEKRRRRRS